MSTSTKPAGLVGIDLGTASVKVVVTNHDGALLAQAGEDYAVRHPHPGWAESDPQDWLQATATAVRNALAIADVTPSAVGLSGQMHGVVVTDQNGVPLRPAMLWSDARATAEVDRYRALPDHLRARLANPLVPGMAGPLLAWLAPHEPQHFRDIRWALQPKDWLRLQITGEVHTEPSDASATLLYDLTADDWDRDVLDRLGVDPQVLPNLLRSSSDHAGTITREAAALLGVPEGTPVAAGAADTAAALLGAGMLDPGTTQLTIGTGIQIVTPLDELPADLPPHPVTHTYRTTGRSGWYAMAAVLNGGSTLAWVRQILGLSWAELYRSATLPPQDDDPQFLPHLHGERTPWLDPTLRGAWTDLNPRHDRSRLARAALEGVAIAVKEAFDVLPQDTLSRSPVRLAGGGTVVPAWRQMLADALARPLEAVEVNAASGLGAALLAGMSTQVIAAEHRQPASGEAVTTPARGGIDLFAERAARSRQRILALRGVTS
jgi:xylulokinase